MNKREIEIKKKYEAMGFRVLRNGAPDFLVLRIVDGKILDGFGVEVKQHKDHLRYEQEIYKRFFEQKKIPFIVERI